MKEIFNDFFCVEWIWEIQSGKYSKINEKHKETQKMVCVTAYPTTLRTRRWTSSRGAVVFSGRRNSMAWHAASSSMASTVTETQSGASKNEGLTFLLPIFPKKIFCQFFLPILKKKFLFRRNFFWKFSKKKCLQIFQKELFFWKLKKHFSANF